MKSVVNYIHALFCFAWAFCIIHNSKEIYFHYTLKYCNIIEVYSHFVINWQSIMLVFRKWKWYYVKKGIWRKPLQKEKAVHGYHEGFQFLCDVFKCPLCGLKQLIYAWFINLLQNSFIYKTILKRVMQFACKCIMKCNL